MSDLDRFRQEWREEVRERASHRAEGRRRQRNEFQHLSSVAQSNPTVVVHNENAFKAERPKDIYINETLSELDLLALDDFEKAVDREHVGKLGDAVKYYRDAFRKNEQVDKLFREKYYSKKGHQSLYCHSPQNLRKLIMG
jgi:F-box protein 9